MPRTGVEEGSISGAATLRSPTPSVLGKNHGIAGFSFDYLRYRPIPPSDAHRLHHRGHDVHGKNHDETYSLVGGIGILNDLDLYVSAPIVSKSSIEVHDHELLGDKERAAGFGDMRAVLKYRFLKRFVEAAVLAGMKFPTGRTKAKRRSGDKFAAENQPGSGSWDGQFGIAAARRVYRRLSAVTSFEYSLNGEGAEDHKLGDVFRYNLGTSVLLRESGIYPNLSMIAELNHEWALKDHSREAARVMDSGGTSIFVSPGVILDLTGQWSFFWGMSLPVYQNLGGKHEETRFSMTAGTTFAF
ncbi:MAG: hypothetical protein A2Z83_04255 [Omnitrophica bacterium GWA2_52_8]|nr:MAG: hypothetical protein A2Z83_04255 [Omnitrophica bacterium GWA2_52_8]